MCYVYISERREGQCLFVYFLNFQLTLFSGALESKYLKWFFLKKKEEKRKRKSLGETAKHTEETETKILYEIKETGYTYIAF